LIEVCVILITDGVSSCVQPQFDQCWVYGCRLSRLVWAN